MKKTYINPETIIVNIKTVRHIMAGSDMDMLGDYDSGTTTIGSRRRGNDFWDDEDDYDE